MKAPYSSLFVAAMASLALVGCQGGGGAKSVSGANGDLAVVNGEAITMDEYFRYLERKPLVQVSNGQGGVAEVPVAAPLGFQAMRDLINRRILIDVARDEKVMPTDAEIQKELDFQTKMNPQFIPKLTGQGLSLEDIRRDLTLDLAKEHIITKGITVTMAEAEKFIKDNPDQFLTPEQAKLCVVTVKDKAGQASVDKALAANTPFPEVAFQYSTAPNARETKGYYPVTNVAQMPADVQQIVANTAEGKTSNWLPAGTQFVKIFVEQKVKAKPMTLNDQQKELVRRQLAMRKGSAAIDLSKRLVDKLKSAKIAVTPPSLKTLWEPAFKQLQQQQATQDVQPATGTGATAGGTTAGAPAVGATAGSPAPTTP